MSTASRNLVAAVLVGAVGAPLLGDGQPTRPVLRPVDPNVADVSPLAGPGRVMPADTRQPASFDRVYEVEMSGKRYFARANAGTIAVFPRSTYAMTGSGAMPTIPAGTTFYLGSLPKNPAPVSDAPSPFSALRSPTVPVPSRALDTFIDRAFVAGPDSRPAMPTTSASRSVSGSLWESEAYRVWRTGELIDAAAVVHARVNTVARP